MEIPVRTQSLTYSLVYHTGLHAVVLRWLVPGTLAEERASYVAALVLAQQYGCASWLLDSRLAGPIDAGVAQWLVHEFLPLAAARLAPTRLRLAVVSSLARLAQMQTDAAVAPVVAHALAQERPYEAGIFYDEGSAVAWLMALPA